MTTVKPVSEKDTPDAFQHMSGCLKSFTNLLVKFLFWTGLGPFKIDEKTGTMDFKLFSVSSFLAFIRLFLFNFPVLVLPIILFVGGPMKKEEEDITGKSFTGLETPIQSVGAIYQVEYCMGIGYACVCLGVCSTGCFNQTHQGAASHFEGTSDDGKGIEANQHKTGSFSNTLLFSFCTWETLESAKSVDQKGKILQTLPKWPKINKIRGFSQTE